MTTHEALPEDTAVRVALWRALHVMIDAPPHVFHDEVGLKLVAPDEGWQSRPDMSPFTRPFRASIVARARFIEDLVAEIVTVEVGAVCQEMLELYQTDGIIAEPAGALATAALDQVTTDGIVVCIVSGGNNDVSRYADILERALVHQGLRHYFLVSFPQEPGALRGFLDDVLSDGEDIVVFDYIKKSNRETGPALIGLDLDSADRLPALLERMKTSPLDIEPIPYDSPLFTFLH